MIGKGTGTGRVPKTCLPLSYNQKEFAANLGISNASLSEMEAGNARPRLYSHLEKYIFLCRLK
jgi:hypothetical protein